MSTNITHETRIEADPNLPTVLISREFDAPVDRVYRAHVDPELAGRWMGAAVDRHGHHDLGDPHRRRVSLHRSARR